MKQIMNGKFGTMMPVTPFVGVWIETMKLSIVATISDVTPFVGVWIETSNLKYHQ